MMKNLIEKTIISLRESMRLWQIFQQNQFYSDLATSNLAYVLDYRGIELNDHVLQQAHAAISENRKLTIREFIASYYKPPAPLQIEALKAATTSKPRARPHRKKHR